MTLGHNEDIPRILEAIYSTGDISEIGIAEQTIDHLTKRGFENFRTLSQTQRRLPEPGKDTLSADKSP